MRRFSRTKLRALISEGIEVKYGKTLSSISYDESENGVSAHFADGTSISGDVLIGTDGPRSKARDLIVGEGKSEASPAGVVVAVVRSKYTAEQALAPSACLPYDHCLPSKWNTHSYLRTRFQVVRAPKLGVSDYAFLHA